MSVMTDDDRKLPTMTMTNQKDDKYDKLTKTKKAKKTLTLTPKRKDNINQCSPLFTIKNIIE